MHLFLLRGFRACDGATPKSGVGIVVIISKAILVGVSVKMSSYDWTDRKPHAIKKPIRSDGSGTQRVEWDRQSRQGDAPWLLFFFFCDATLDHRALAALIQYAWTGKLAGRKAEAAFDYASKNNLPYARFCAMMNRPWC